MADPGEGGPEFSTRKAGHPIKGRSGHGGPERGDRSGVDPSPPSRERGASQSRLHASVARRNSVFGVYGAAARVMECRLSTVGRAPAVRRVGRRASTIAPRYAVRHVRFRSGGRVGRLRRDDGRRRADPSGGWPLGSRMSGPRRSGGSRRRQAAARPERMIVPTCSPRRAAVRRPGTRPLTTWT